MDPLVEGESNRGEDREEVGEAEWKLGEDDMTVGEEVGRVEGEEMRVGEEWFLLEENRADLEMTGISTEEVSFIFRPAASVVTTRRLPGAARRAPRLCGSESKSIISTEEQRDEEEVEEAEEEECIRPWEEETGRLGEASIGSNLESGWSSSSISTRFIGSCCIPPGPLP